MTALNCFVGKSAVHVFTDGVHIEEGDAATICGLGDKVYLMSHCNAVFASSGYAWGGLLLWASFTESGIASLGEFATRFDNEVRRATEKWSNIPGSHQWRDFDVLLAGFDTETNQPVAKLCQAMWSNVSGQFSFRTQNIRKSINPDDDCNRFPPFREETAEADGVAILEVQRAHVWRGMSDHRAKRAVGGYAQYTKVDASGISARVLKRWPDVMGQRVANDLADPGEALPVMKPAGGGSGLFG